MHFLSKGFQGLLCREYSKEKARGNWEASEKWKGTIKNKHGGSGIQVAIETRSGKIHMWKSIILKPSFLEGAEQSFF